MDDQILVRAGRSMVPTPFTLRAASSVRALLDEADSLTALREEEPASWNRSFTIRCNDGLTPVLAPALVAHVLDRAPGVVLRFVSQESKDPDPLRDGSLDLDIGIRVQSPPDVLASPLLTDRLVAAVGARSALGGKDVLSVDDLAEHPHISASRRGLARGPIDQALEALGKRRRVVAIAPTYAIAAMMVLESELICLLPELMTRHLVERGVPLRHHEIPFDLPKVEVEQRWHRRHDTDPASQWLRSALHAVAADQHPR